MCGIAGLMMRDPGLAEASLREQMRRMTGTLRHRGPDGSGVWIDRPTGVALGHRRLAILDLTPSGAQPMVSGCGRFVLTYNGEVYNFQELRRELTLLGHRFRGQSDTEVVLAAIAEWGIESTVQRLNGMFAFGVWDREASTLTLARDRVGKKPLYYGWFEDVFLFGSELKALRSHPSFVPDIDADALGLLIQYSWISAPYSIFKRVLKLPAGTLLRVSATGAWNAATPTPYWSARDLAERADGDPFQGSFEEAGRVLHSLLTDSVRRRMVADVDLGAFLSGGVDSTTVVALMQAASSQPVKTFTVGFHEPRFNEADHALAIARHLGTDHTELYVTAKESIDVIPELPTIYDEPLADPSQIPTFLISRLARTKVTVALSGDGGDELFAGYKRYLSCRKYGKVLRWIPGFLARQAASLLGTLDRAVWTAVGARRLAGPFDRLEGGRPGVNLDRIASRLGATGPEELLARRHAGCQDPREYLPASRLLPTTLTDRARWARVSESVRGMMYLDFMTFLPDDVLTKVDRASMAVGLEVRCPFLDPQVIEFAWRLPRAMWIGESGGKRIVRTILERYCPPALTDRPKMGFGVPIGEWVRGPLREWAEDLLAEKRLVEQGFFRPEAVRQIWLQHLSGWRNREGLLWSILMFQAWLSGDRHKSGAMPA